MVLADAPARVELVLVGKNQLRNELPRDVQEVMKQCEQEGRFDSAEYGHVRCSISAIFAVWILGRMKSQIALEHLKDEEGFGTTAVLIASKEP